MALLPILRFPDPRLKKVALPVDNVDDEVRRLAHDMAETMYEAPGIGLAATQVDVHRRVIVIDISETRDQLLVVINPELIASEGEQVEDGVDASGQGYREAGGGGGVGQRAGT